MTLKQALIRSLGEPPTKMSDKESKAKLILTFIRDQEKF